MLFIAGCLRFFRILMQLSQSVEFSVDPKFLKDLYKQSVLFRQVTQLLQPILLFALFQGKYPQHLTACQHITGLGDNSSQATIRPRRQFVPNSKKRQFVPSVNSSHFEKATIRPICKKRQFVPNCLNDQLITNLMKVETKEIIKPTTNEFIQPRDNN